MRWTAVKPLIGTSGAAVALLLLQACTSTPGTRSAPVSVDSHVTTEVAPSDAEQGPANSRRPSLATEPVWSGVYGVGATASLALSHKFLAFAFGAGTPQPTDQLASVNLRTREQAVIARSRWKSGYISGVAVSGATVVWVDQDRVASSLDLRAKWRMIALDLDTGQRRLLSSSRGEKQIWQPTPHADARRVVWSEQVRADRPAINGSDRLTGFTLYSWKTGSARPIVLVRRVRMAAGSERPAGRTTAYVSISSGYDNGYQESNVETLRPDGSRTRLSNSGRVSWVAANRTSAVWAENRDPKRAEFADPFTHWVRPVDGDAPAVRIQRGYSAGNVVAGSAFAAWWPLSANAIKLSALDGGATAVIHDRPMFVPARLAASGDLLAYATEQRRGRINVHVVRVTDGRHHGR